MLKDKKKITQFNLVRLHYSTSLTLSRKEIITSGKIELTGQVLIEGHMSGAGTDHHLTMGRGPNMQTKQYSVHLLISLLEQKYTGEQLRGHGCDMSDQC